MAETVFLYKITNPKGRIYIGQTVDPRKRFIVYARNAIPAQKRLFASISKYGWTAHTTEIISSFSASEIDYAEKYMIAWHNSTGKEGLNILSGGQIRKTDEQNKRHSILMTGRKHSPERIEKARVRMIGNKHSKGSVRSDEFKRNASEKLKGFKRVDTSMYKVPKFTLRKPVVCLTKDGLFVKEYPSVLDTEKDGFLNSHVSKVCNNERMTHRGFVFKFKDNG